MKTLITLFISLITIALWAQTPKVQFQKLVHDFGPIKEVDGNVLYAFSFKNVGNVPVVIDTVQTGCGCTAYNIFQDTVFPGQYSAINIIYDPKDRPGKFAKAIDVEFRSDTIRLTQHLNIRGIVIGKDILPDPSQDIEYRFKIKPFIANLSDMKAENEDDINDFNRFINELTYIIDQDGFVNIEIEIALNESREGFYDQIINEYSTAIKETILKAFERRNYNQFQVGFVLHRVSSSLFNFNNEKSHGLCRISSKDYNDSRITESSIRPVNQYKPNESEIADTLFFIKNAIYTKVIPLEAAQDKNVFNDLIKQHGHNLIADPNSKLFIRLSDAYTDYKNVPEKKKSLEKSKKKLEKNWNKAVKKNQIPFSSGRFISPEIKIHEVKNKENIDTLQFCQIAIVIRPETEQNKEVITDSSFFIAKKEFEQGKQFLPQTLPTHLQKFYGRKTVIDTTDAHFVFTMNNLLLEMNKGKKVTILLESSASNAPISGNLPPIMKARQQARESKEIILSYLNKRKYPHEFLNFASPISLVRGPEYNTRYWFAQEYYQYQYIKIIPLYNNKSSDIYIPPYMINFDYNNSDLHPESRIFQNFIDKVKNTIERDGYVEIIIESSASKSPTYTYRDNHVLAFKRVEDAYEDIIEELEIRGIDSKRVIISEERTLIQGPEWVDGESEEIYKPYQYIKIIPKKLVE